MGQQPGTLTLNRQQFQRMAAELPVYQHLEGAIGAGKAPEVVRLLYERRVLETNPEGRYVLVEGGDTGAEAAGLALVLEAECSRVTAKRAYLRDLLAAAVEGRLRQKLGPVSERRGHFAREAEIRTATAWICQTLHGGRQDTVHALLTEHAIPAPGSEVLGPTPALLDSLHARIFPNAPVSRSPNPETAYPSSIGGRQLLEEVFAQTAEAVWPLPGDAWWLDVALFYMGAIGTVQGYADGNKRAARIAYAVILLHGRRPFIEPSPELEADLFQMHGPAGS